MKITREQFDFACEAVWKEIEYQSRLARRTEDRSDPTGEAHDVPGFLTLLRRYERKVEDAWADNGAPVEEALHGLRKLAAISLCAMLYCGWRDRDQEPGRRTRFKTTGSALEHIDNV